MAGNNQTKSTSASHEASVCEAREIFLLLKRINEKTGSKDKTEHKGEEFLNRAEQ